MNSAAMIREGYREARRGLPRPRRYRSILHPYALADYTTPAPLVMKPVTLTASEIGLSAARDDWSRVDGRGL